MFNLQIKIKDERKTMENIQKMAEQRVESISPIVGQILQEEMAKRSKFPINLEMQGNVAVVGPDVKNAKEEEEAIEEATKGGSPQFAVQFKMANRDWMVQSLKAKGIKDVK